tara:strand:+ start:47 stop:928 length:882 start_codon:yes stop_codon:yes gene_type:complete
LIEIQRTPNKFLDTHVRSYPPHNDEKYIEQYFYEEILKNNNLKSRLTYLPVQWTNYIADNNYGKNIDELQNWISNLNRKEKNKNFFTIVQYAGGPLVDLDNTLVFSSGGMFNTSFKTNLSYIKIPLLTKPHEIKITSKKKYLASYQGRPTHPIREDMIKLLSKSKGFNLKNIKKITKKDQSVFVKKINQSYFSICPRGTGPTSFRLYESFGLNSIPVYVSDEFYLPFTEIIDWKKLIVFIKENEIDNMPKMLTEIVDSGKYNEMLEYGNYCYSKYFNLKFVSSYIKNTVEFFK